MLKKITSFEEYVSQYALSVTEPEQFWEEKAKSFLWKKPWDKTLEWDFKTPKVEWFKGGELNITENCIDRHLKAKGDKPAIIWEPNNPKDKGRTLTYSDLSTQVNKLANALQLNGIKKGDRVCLYMPMVPELAIALLACARIGAIHSVVFAGFSAKALTDRINDSDCKMVITADGFYRGTKYVNLKKIVDEALQKTPTIESVLVYKHSNQDIDFDKGRDLWWHEAVDAQNAFFNAVPVESEDPLFILYTSGSTGKPKGVVHSTAGYMVYAEYSFRNVFQYEENDIYWCTADIGWITGHSYIVYGPLLAGATSVMFEGVPTWPDAGRFWSIVEKYKVNTFYTAPTAIRALEAFDDSFVTQYDLSSLKVLGTVGEPINDEAWQWYHTVVGKNNCPIVDTWWQTETGGIMISPMGNLWDQKPSYATFPLPGIQPCLVDEKGVEIEGNDVEGNLCIKFPWPSMIRTTWGDHERCKSTYFSIYKNMYFTGDGCKRDKNGMYRIIGRVDDVINVSGHRIGTAEVEDAINEHEHIVESAVVGYPHNIKGQGIMAYVICHPTIKNYNEEQLFAEIRAEVVKQIGAIAKPDRIVVVEDLPKTRSGKIMRRILRKVAQNETENLGDTSTLLNPGIVQKIVSKIIN